MDGAAPATSPPPDWRLNALALLGGLVYQVIVLAPLGLLLMLSALQLGAAWAWWLTAMMLLGAWWLMQGTDPPEGHDVSRDEAPVLWTDLDGLADRMQVPRLRRVVLVHEPNAAAVEHQDSWWPWRYHRTLVLGVPLLAGLPADEVRAVVAHELGHFSRHFGWRGHWLYRTRIGWAELLHDDDNVAWYRAAAEYARWFVPVFERLSATRAVHNEYEADALAARFTSPAALGAGLARMRVGALRDAPPFGEGELPADPLGQWGPGMADAVTPDDIRRALRQDTEWHARQDPADVTHPPVIERMHALGLAADGLALNAIPAADRAGPVWWGAGWSQRLAQENTRWHATHGRAWRMAASWRRACTTRLRAPAPDELAVECALALEQVVAPPIDGDATASHPPLQAYWAGMAWLAHDRATAERWLEAAIPGCVALAAPARRHLLERHGDAMTPSQRKRHQQLYAQALRRRGDARTKAAMLGWAAGEAADVEPWRRAALVEALAGDDAIERAAWVRYDVTLSSGRSYRVVCLGLQIRLGDGVPEAGIARAYEGLLTQVISPACVALVRTCWTTEEWPEPLQRQAQRTPHSKLKPAV